MRQVDDEGGPPYAACYYYLPGNPRIPILLRCLPWIITPFRQPSPALSGLSASSLPPSCAPSTSLLAPLPPFPSLLCSPCLGYHFMPNLLVRLPVILPLTHTRSALFGYLIPSYLRPPLIYTCLPHTHITLPVVRICPHTTPTHIPVVEPLILLFVAPYTYAFSY